MFPFCDSPSPMDIPLYQQLQLTPPSPPKPSASDHHQSSFFYYSPSFAAADAATGGDTIGSPLVMLHPFMDIEQQQQPQPQPQPVVAVEDVAGTGADILGGLDGAAARKDRHSKICTAGGMRDRRMRLSLDVARKFFALQDMLGFDKASKTVQWLLNMSKAAIREIMSDDASSVVCEEDGGSSSLSVDAAAGSKHHTTGTNNPPAPHGTVEGKKPAPKPRRAAATPKPPRRLTNAHLPVPDKESRAKARERARERTREKNRMRWVTLASAISVEQHAATAADKSPTSPTNLQMSAELEEGSSSTLHNGVGGGGRMQEISVANEASDDVIMAFAHDGGGGAYGGDSSNYYQQQPQDQWELGGVVFANSRHY